jgi:hypothetical protein
MIVIRWVQLAIIRNLSETHKNKSNKIYKIKLIMNNYKTLDRRHSKKLYSISVKYQTNLKYLQKEIKV